VLVIGCGNVMDFNSKVYRVVYSN